MQSISEAEMLAGFPEDSVPVRISFPLIFKLQLDPDFKDFDIIIVSTDCINETCVRAISEERARAEAEGKDVIIFVAYSDGDRDQESLALEAGADECYKSVSDRRHIMVHLRSLARHKRVPHGRSHVLSVDPRTHQALVHGRPIAVSPLEFRFLFELQRQAGHVVPREKLAMALWGDSNPSSIESLRHLVYRLRARLGSAAEEIVTIPRVGYILKLPPAGDNNSHASVTNP